MKAIQHARHGQIYRMANEDAALLVSSGRYVYISKFQARAIMSKPRHRWWRIAATIGAILALLAISSAAQARPCESLATVQKKHPGQHPHYRQVDGRKCWYVGKRVPAKSEFDIKSSRGDDRGGPQGIQRFPSSTREGRAHVTSLPKSQDVAVSTAAHAGVASGPREAVHAGEGMHQRPDGLRALDEQNLRKSPRSEPAPDALALDHELLCGGTCPDFRTMPYHDAWAALRREH